MVEYEGQTGEDLAQLIQRLKDAYGVNESEIARAIDAAPATVNAWVHRKRGGTKGPRRALLERLAAAYPRFTREEIFAAAGRRTPGNLSDDTERELTELFAELTAEQQELTLIQMRALRNANQQ
ncbi:XRE family transcriptional regulator [Streptomyces sp. NPDC086023]|uniref:XRE family transcriptional regulator n=1 Tax=Streptomyces sp. NPDC086023 TaxID=3365746 RepID=UPI0037D2DF8E